MNYIKSLLAPSDHPESLGNKFRSRRFFVFENLILKNFPEVSPIHILDVGGTAYFWKNMGFLQKYNIHITLLNLEKEAVNAPRISSMAGDATDLSVFKDGSFDLVFSNSVIEHLYTWENQNKMAEEVMRVGKKFFIQTPNKHFFIEAHYALPFIQYIPKKSAFHILTQTKISRMQKWAPKDAQQYLDEIRLISQKEMQKLFPGAKLYKEKFLGMTKSFTAHNL